MAMPILDSLGRLIGPAVTSRLAATTGETETAIGKGLAAAIPTILALLCSRAGNRDAMSQVFALAKDPVNDPALLDNPGRFIDAAGRTLAEAGPASQLQSLLFGDAGRGLTDAIAGFAGLKPSSARSVLSTTVPMVLAYLNRLIRQDNLDSEALARRLQSDREAAAAAVPAGLASLLPAGLLDTVGSHATGAVAAASAAATGATTRAATASSRISPAGWISAAVVALLALWGLWALVGRERPGGVTGAVGTSGYLTRALPNNTSLRFPPNGTEARLLDFIESGSPASREVWFEFDRLHFDTNAATLRPESREQLSNIAAILRAFPGIRVKIGGYTDNSGDAGANLQLSQARADTVRVGLVEQNVDASRVEAEGYGDQHPIADNSTAEGRARNRRVAVRVTQK